MHSRPPENNEDHGDYNIAQLGHRGSRIYLHEITRLLRTVIFGRVYSIWCHILVGGVFLHLSCSRFWVICMVEFRSTWQLTWFASAVSLCLELVRKGVPLTESADRCRLPPLELTIVCWGISTVNMLPSKKARCRLHFLLSLRTYFQYVMVDRAE